MNYLRISQPVVGFRGQRLPDPTWALSLDPLGYFRPQTPNLPTPGNNPVAAHD